MSGDPIADFRRLTPDELRKKLQALNAFCMGAPTELAEFACGLLGHLKRLSDDTFDFVEDMEVEIEGLPQAHAGKRFLLRQVRRLPFENPLIGEKISDRLHKALINKPPDAEKKKAKKAIMMSGKEWVFPEGLAPDD
jgi:hypothetical protein